jgi:hypothetical protein
LRCEINNKGMRNRDISRPREEWHETKQNTEKQRDPKLLISKLKQKIPVNMRLPRM